MSTSAKKSYNGGSGNQKSYPRGYSEGPPAVSGQGMDKSSKSDNSAMTQGSDRTTNTGRTTAVESQSDS